MVRSSVVFPAPLWPRMATASPFFTFRPTSSSTRFLPKPVLMPLTRSIGSESFATDPASDGAKIDLRKSRVGGQLPDCPLGCDVTELHEEDRISQLLHHVQTVLDNTDGLASIARIDHQFEKLIDPAGVDAGGGLIEEKHISIRRH